MRSRDRRLGMHRAISRRDFLNGVSVAIGASLLPGCTKTGEPTVDAPSAYYPPAATGMRGSHPGSFEAAHASIEGIHWEPERTNEHFDLVVVGAGISGLASAYIYRRDVDPDARILILDNHDDFGGHAKRNEFTLDGKTYIGYGGTMYMVAPDTYPAVAKQVIRELGIDASRNAEFYHDDIFPWYTGDERRATFFDKETFGADFLATGEHGFAGSIEETPLSEPARAELLRLYAGTEDYLRDMTPAERRAVLESHSWREYLEKFAGLGEEALTFMQRRSNGGWAIGADAMPAWLARMAGYEGFSATDFGDNEDEEDSAGNFFFPDGNASIARMLVRKLIPAVAPGSSMEDIVTARFDYAGLDQTANKTRIRLSSTVIGLYHQDGYIDGDVDVSYVTDSEARTVTAGKVVWAGYHSMLPHICPDIPTAQAAALSSAVRAPLVYTNVLIRNWQSLAKLDFRRAYCPGSFFSNVMFTHPVSMGEYRFSQSPDDPIVLHLTHIPLAPGLPAAEQFREGRRALLETSFETFERNVRDQLGRMLGPGGFDPGRDIAGITVNRWPHGYAFSVDTESGDVAWWPEYWKHQNRPWVDARQPVGHIAIAGTDASSNAMTESAIEEAHRAVHSLES